VTGLSPGTLVLPCHYLPPLLRTLTLPATDTIGL
jgi:hypothetical protein